jgi:type II secretory pathway pseudopilin PulG
MRDRSEAGETLIEVLISLVVIGAIVAAFFAGIVTTSRATASQRDLVNADAVLRDYAEVAKQSVRASCTGANTGATVPLTSTPVVPSGLVLTPIDLKCPPVTGAGVGPVHIEVTLTSGAVKTLDILVRTP